MDDAEIVRLYWDRNEQALDATADKYGSYCTAIAKNILGNQEDAEECVNDTYMRAWKAIDIRTFSTGFEALVRTEDIGAFSTLSIEPATMDEIVVFTSKKGARHE